MKILLQKKEKEKRQRMIIDGEPGEGHRKKAIFVHF